MDHNWLVFNKKLNKLFRWLSNCACTAVGQHFKLNGSTDAHDSCPIRSKLGLCGNWHTGVGLPLIGGGCRRSTLLEQVRARHQKIGFITKHGQRGGVCQRLQKSREAEREDKNMTCTNKTRNATCTWNGKINGTMSSAHRTKESKRGDGLTWAQRDAKHAVRRRLLQDRWARHLKRNYNLCLF